ncbi:glycosyl transferase family 2 [Nostocales cyanobacterium HT-58-2]|nr:glycosyl transferase family 2 [Nostocales cyanobacterium HT-58-2]
MSNLSLHPTDNHTSIDLVICTYNNAELLDRALIAISKQQVPDDIKWTVLVVNNNCTDETAQVVDRHIQSQKIPYLSTILEPKQGLNHARQCGVINTTGDWIAFVDDDCILEEDWVAQAGKFAAAHPHCGAFGGRVILDWETPPPAFVLKYGYSFAQQDHGMSLTQPNCLVGAGLVVNRKAVLATNWVSKQFLSDRVGKKLISGGDVEMVLRIRSAGYDIWYNPACKLMHFIPSRRIEQKYLININYGLGISQLMSDGLVWHSSFFNLLVLSVFSTFRSSIAVFVKALKVALGRGNMEVAEIAIIWAFVQGKWVGIGRMLRMDAQERRALLGSAKLVSSNN